MAERADLAVAEIFLMLGLSADMAGGRVNTEEEQSLCFNLA